MLTYCRQHRQECEQDDTASLGRHVFSLVGQFFIRRRLRQANIVQICTLQSDASHAGLNPPEGSRIADGCYETKSGAFLCEQALCDGIPSGGKELQDANRSGRSHLQT